MINQQKIKEWVELFREHIGEITPEVHVEKYEGYKFKSVDVFQREFNIDDPNLEKMLERSIMPNNLVQGSFYFPRAMLLFFADTYPEETRAILKKLFSEDGSVGARIDYVVEAFNSLKDKFNKEKGKHLGHTFVGTRFSSLILSFRFPEKYHAMKPKEWRVFCKYIDKEFSIPKGSSEGEKYEIFVPYINALRDYIDGNHMLKDLRDHLTRGLEFKDEAMHWTTQDVIYVTARILANKRSEEVTDEDISKSEEVVGEEGDGATINQTKIEIDLEKALENLMIKNWKIIDLGEPLELYRDGDGEIAQQYVTSVGIIDILAKDKKGNFVVIELKKGRTGAKVVGQILNYMGWVSQNLVEKDQVVRGIIIAAEGAKDLFSAVSMVADRISVKYYDINLRFVDPEPQEE